MSKFKEKTQGFLFGLMVGLIVAGGFFILKLDSYFKELNFYKSIIHTFSYETKTPETSENKKEENNDKGGKGNTSGSENKNLSSNDSLKSKNLNTDLEVDEDSLYAALVADTLAEKNKLNENTSTSEDVVVKKDELIATKTLEIISLNPQSNKNNAKDSLLQKVSGVQDDKGASSRIFNVEFWQSPLNYKGYKLSKNKMVLYGMPSEDAVKVYKMDENIYLKALATVYKLDYTGDFKSYERITDESIISKLK